VRIGEGKRNSRRESGCRPIYYLQILGRW